MKTLKLDHARAAEILRGTKTSTWRVNDDKDLHVHDKVVLVDKVNPADITTWEQIGTAQITSVLEKPLGSVNQSDLDQGQRFTTTEDIIKELRGYYGPQVSADTPVKIIKFIFSKAESEPEKNDLVTENIKRARLFADGGSRGNPGPSAFGFVLLDKADLVIVEKGGYLGVTTNNQAEYQALKSGLEEALKLGYQELDVYMDSMLVINQMKGSFKVKNTDLQAINITSKALAAKFQRIAFTHVPRELNRKADAVVNKVLDEQATRA